MVYPGVEAFLPEFLASLTRQTDRQFVLFLINDGLADLNGFLKEAEVPARQRAYKGSPAALRKAGIEWVVSEGVEAVVFADADDYFADNRVEISKQKLAGFDICFNEIMVVSETLSSPLAMLGRYFSEGQEVFAKTIEKANCMGLTNTSARAACLQSPARQIPDDIIAFDWALFAMCLQSGSRATFTKKTASYYRQYDDNVASLLCLSEEKIFQGVRVKCRHYQLLSRFFKAYARPAEKFKRLLHKLEHDEQIRKRYCRAVRSRSLEIPLWWEHIQTLEEIGL